MLISQLCRELFLYMQELNIVSSHPRLLMWFSGLCHLEKKMRAVEDLTQVGDSEDA
jgi:hypothetical protein